MSTRIFSSYLRSMDLRSRQYDAFDALGFIVTDEFENGNILDQTYPNVASALTLGSGDQASIAVVTAGVIENKPSTRDRSVTFGVPSG
jgi:aspartate kinase